MGDIHNDRRQRLAGLVAKRDADAALITRLVNVRYLTGLASSNAALLVRADGTALLATDGRYAGAAARVCPDLEVVVNRRVALALTPLAADSGARRLAFEAHEVTVEQHAELATVDQGIERAGAVWTEERPASEASPRAREQLAERALRATASDEGRQRLQAPARRRAQRGNALELVPLGHAVEELRTVKDEDEIALLREACTITDRAFDAILPAIAPGVTEREIAVELERRMVDLGAERPSFESIVAGGPNGAIPHHHPGDRPVEDGDLLTMDFGALYGGYHADMTRTVAVGRVANWQLEVYELVRRAQQAGVDAAAPGAETKAVDAAARDLIKAAGYGEQFVHGLGHGVGLEIHEAPLLGYDKTGKLSDRVPITSEPGVYLDGRGGVRIEDTLVVRADGPEILTKTTKELLVL